MLLQETLLARPPSENLKQETDRSCEIQEETRKINSSETIQNMCGLSVQPSQAPFSPRSKSAPASPRRALTDGVVTPGGGHFLF